MGDDLEQRARHVEALSLTPGDGAARELSDYLRETSWSLRDRAVAALAGRDDAVEPTIAVVEDGPWFAKVSACDVLARLGDARAAAALARALLDRNVSVQKSAAQAMQELVRRHGPDLFAHALADLAPMERRAAAARLVHQVPDLVPLLAAVLASSRSASDAVDEDAPSEIAAIRRFRSWLASNVPERERAS